METEFFELLNENIKRFAFLHYDAYGRPVNSTAYTSYLARVAYHGKKKRDKKTDTSQLEKVQSATIWVNSTGTFSLEDIVEIKEGFRPRIINVEAFPDERDTYHHVKLTCGD